MLQNNTDHKHFVVPLRFYVGTLISLLLLTVITVWVSRFNFGDWNLPIAMFVAVLKASLVVQFFMGMKWEKGFNFIFFLSGLLVLFLFFLFVFSDVMTRGDIEPEEQGVHNLKVLVRPISSERATGH